jgi:hypothetical protein
MRIVKEIFSGVSRPPHVEFLVHERTALADNTQRGFRMAERGPLKNSHILFAEPMNDAINRLVPRIGLNLSEVVRHLVNLGLRVQREVDAAAPKPAAD